MAMRSALSKSPNALALALVKSSVAPLLLLDADQRVLAASLSFHQVFGVAAGAVNHTPLAELDAGRWDSPPLQALLAGALAAVAEGEGREVRILLGGIGNRHVVANARRLDCAPGQADRLILTLADVTEVEIAERLNERRSSQARHRAANNLQLVAGVLLLSVQGARSPETRRYLQETYLRVLSIAVAQRQPSAPSIDEVSLKTYLPALCEHIGAGASDTQPAIHIGVTTEDSVAGIDVCVSLGLLVTELLIDAVRHPGRDAIMVVFRSNETRWLLSVSDNGVPAPSRHAKSRPGPGMITLLARQLNARVRTQKLPTGTRVCVIGKPGDGTSGPRPRLVCH
jgi:two-component system, sensor histidine kinase PdtaS